MVDGSSTVRCLVDVREAFVRTKGIRNHARILWAVDGVWLELIDVEQFFQVDAATARIGEGEDARALELLLDGEVPVVGLRAGIVVGLRRVVEREKVAADAARSIAWPRLTVEDG